MGQKDLEHTITPKEPKELERLKQTVRGIYEWCKTAEAEAWAKDFLPLMKRLEQQEQIEKNRLTVQEEKALHFIREELLLHRQPSVRDVAGAVGLRSSRSGAQIINTLISKGYLLRPHHGFLESRAN